MTTKQEGLTAEVGEVVSERLTGDGGEAMTTRAAKRSVNVRRRRERERHAGRALMRWIALQPRRVWVLPHPVTVRFLAAAEPYRGGPVVMR